MFCRVDIRTRGKDAGNPSKTANAGLAQLVEHLICNQALFPFRSSTYQQKSSMLWGAAPRESAASANIFGRALCGSLILALMTACSPGPAPYCSDLLAQAAKDDARLLRDINEIRREIRRGPQANTEEDSR